MDADREFHDALFSPQQYDPFTFAYPGYLTIRRFADLASERLTNVRRAADLGCGPGEITCALARRHPGIAFVGVEHMRALHPLRMARRRYMLFESWRGDEQHTAVQP